MMRTGLGSLQLDMDEMLRLDVKQSMESKQVYFVTLKPYQTTSSHDPNFKHRRVPHRYDMDSTIFRPRG